MKAAVVGLGSMGYGIAASLLRAGHATLGFDTPPGAGAAVPRRGRRPGHPGRGGRALDALVVVVLNAAQTEAVLVRRRLAPPPPRAPSSSPAPPSLPDFARRHGGARAARPGSSTSTRRSRAAPQGGERPALGHGLGQPASLRRRPAVPRRHGRDRLRARRRAGRRLGDEGRQPAPRRRAYRRHGRGADLRDDARRRPGPVPRGDHAMRRHQLDAGEPRARTSSRATIRREARSTSGRRISASSSTSRGRPLLRPARRRRAAAVPRRPGLGPRPARTTPPSPRSMPATPASPCPEPPLTINPRLKSGKPLSSHFPA